MLSAEWIVLIILVLLESLVAFLLNIGIVLADIRSWGQGQKLNHSDLIHLLMGLINIILQCSLTVQAAVYVFYLRLFLLMDYSTTMRFFTMFLIYSSYWLSTLLCVYYCTSITNLPHRLFIWLKKIVSVYLPHLVLLSLVASFIITVPSIWLVNVTTEQTLRNGSLDPSAFRISFLFDPFYLQTANFWGCCFPFLLTLISVVVTVSSLLKHIWKVKQSDSGFGGSKLRAHINAIRTMVLFLALFTIYYVNVNMFFVNLNTENPVTIIGWIVFMSFPLAESVIIIQASTKLRKLLFGKMIHDRTETGPTQT